MDIDGWINFNPDLHTWRLYERGEISRGLVRVRP